MELLRASRGFLSCALLLLLVPCADIVGGVGGGGGIVHVGNLGCMSIMTRKQSLNLCQSGTQHSPSK